MKPHLNSSSSWWKPGRLLWVCCPTEWDKGKPPLSCRYSICASPVALCAVVSLFLRQKEWQSDLPKPYKLTKWFILAAAEWIWQIFARLKTPRQPPLWSGVLSGTVTKSTAFSLNRGIDLTRTYPQRAHNILDLFWWAVVIEEMLTLHISLFHCRFLHPPWYECLLRVSSHEL